MPALPGQARRAHEMGERRLHSQRRPHGAFGVVLVGDRGTEQGEDSVAEDLVDPASERGDVVDEQLKAGVDQPLDGFRDRGARPMSVKPTRSANSTVVIRRSSACVAVMA